MYIPQRIPSRSLQIHLLLKEKFVLANLSQTLNSWCSKVKNFCDTLRLNYSAVIAAFFITRDLKELWLLSTLKQPEKNMVEN